VWNSAPLPQEKGWSPKTKTPSGERWGITARGTHEEERNMGCIKVSSTRGDYALINLEQVAWATVETNASGTASRITLHMVDGATFSLRDAEAAFALEGLKADLGELPSAPGLPE
jgi:hypothetical protein